MHLPGPQGVLVTLSNCLRAEVDGVDGVHYLSCTTWSTDNDKLNDKLPVLGIRLTSVYTTSSKDSSNLRMSLGSASQEEPLELPLGVVSNHILLVTYT